MRLVLTKQCVVFISFIVWWAHFNYRTVFIYLASALIFMVFTKEDCIYENITKKFVYCGFYFLVIVKNEKTKKNLGLFFILLLNFITPVKGKGCTGRNSTLLLLEYNSFFTRMPSNFLGHKYSKPFQFNFPETCLPNLRIVGGLKLLEDGFF